MKIKSKFKAIDGHLSIFKTFTDGSRLPIFSEANMVMLDSKQYILSTLYSASGTFNPISSLRVGTGGTIDPDGLYPKAVTQLLTQLYTPLLTVPTSFTVNNAVPSVTFIADLDQGTGNGSLITEAGLFQADGSMFNIKAFPGVAKTSEFGLHFQWTVKIS
jgi:hypothetical protein